jgi:hypothetical protein
LEGSLLRLEGLDPAISIPVTGRPFTGDRIIIEYTRPNTYNNIGVLFALRTDSGPRRLKKIFLFPSFADGGHASISLLDLPFPRHAIEHMNLVFTGKQEEVSIHSLSIETLGEWQRMLLPWSRFWKLDEFEPGTINGLRGPVTGSGSANVYLYGIIAAVALPALAVGSFFSRRRQRSRKRIAFGFAAAAVMISIAFYDLRMTAEFTRYTKDNYQYWIAAPAQYKNYKKLYSNIPLFTDWASEQFQTYGVKRYLLHCAQQHFRFFFDYQVYPVTPADPPEALVVWDSPYSIRGSDLVEYAEGRTFRFSRKLSHPFFHDSAIFLSEPNR